GQWRTANGEWRAEGDGEWLMAMAHRTAKADGKQWQMANNGKWQTANSEWQMANGERRMTNGKWRTVNGEG
ncbi:hypothetical protein PAXINDRAFT_87113, partial [Paxillus involutus ATCC 200175]